ncbi:MAG: tetratricopeptide repeat-containing sensor histidine kinase, partial [Bacteroidota bacterium]
MRTSFKSYLFGLWLISSCCQPVFAQDYAQKTDSLHQLLQRQLTPEVTAQTYYDLCANLYYQELHDSVVVYADKGIAIARQSNLTFREAILTEQKALSLEFLDIDRSIEVYLEALAAYERAGKSDWIDEVRFEGVGNAHTILIRMFARRGEMDKAMYHYNIIEGIVQPEQYNTRKAMYESMGFAQAFSGNYREAIRYFKTSVNLGQEAERAIGEPVKGMEENYSLIGSYFSKLNELDSALYYLQIGRTIARDSSRSRIRGRAMVLRISGEIYLDINQLRQAEGYLSEALQTYETIGDAAEISRTAANLAACYLKIQRYSLAVAMAQKAHQTAVVSNDLPSIQQSLTELKQAYLATGQSGKALQTTLELLAVNDSLQSLQNTQLTEEFTKRYESREKQNQIDLQNAQIAQQLTTIWAAVLVAGLLLIIALIIFWTARQQRQTNKILEIQKTQLQELDATKTRFFANISHELRTPLTLILAPLENTIKNSKNSTQKENLELAHANSQKLMTLVNEIMDLSKLESGKIKVETKAVKLTALLRRIFYSYESLAKLRGITLVFDNQLTGDLWVKLDVAKVEKIVNNLLSNALKFSSNGDTITLSLKAGQQVRIAVKDTGKGIPAIDVPRIFDRFYQSKQNTQQLQGGTGIGLALAKEYARLMEGDLTVKSELGKGSIFRLQLPLVEATPVENTTTETMENKVVSPNPNFQPQILFADKPNILVVEDNLEMSQFL